MRYEVKFRFKGAKAWIKNGSYKTFEAAQIALNRFTECTSDCAFLESKIEKVEK